MRDVAIAGAGMTRFGKYLDRGLKDLSREAVDAALDSAGMDKTDLEIAVVGNAAAGLITGQECIRAQVMLRDLGIDKIPMVNTENACASSSTALQVAWLYVASGMYDVALALGVEKMYTADKAKGMAAFGAGVD
ncbi:MAG TPA: beta-ketoacyl synthase N-terminal-like domain-containing protein, partial [Dehalococcoidia bacterium]